MTRPADQLTVVPDPDQPRLSRTVHNVAVLAGLTLAACIGNLAHLHLPYGLDLVFGSIFAMLAIKCLGTPAGVLVAAVSGAYTLVLWHHPYAWLIAVAEATSVGLLRRYLRPHGEVLPLAALDALYWVCLGIPLVVLCYGGPLAMSHTEVLLVALKQAINGVLNASLAGALVIGIRRLRRHPVPVSFSDFLFTTLVLAALAPALGVTVWQNDRLTEAMEQEVADTLTLATRLSAAELAALPPPATLAAARAALPQIIARLSGLLPQAGGIELRIDAADRLEPAERRTDTLAVALAERPGYSHMVCWRKGHYRMQTPLTLAGQPVQLVAELAATQAVQTLQGVQLGGFWQLGLITLCALTGAYYVSRRIGRPIAALAETAGQLPSRLQQTDAPPPPRPSRLREPAELAAAFARMESALRQNFRDLEQSEARLRGYSAKLAAFSQREVIGHLAGGVAHDFNNVLGTIRNNLAYLEHLLPTGADGVAAHNVLAETEAAIDQATLVTSGLLSLGRGEDIEVCPCDLGALVAAFAPALRRLLPPGIELILEVQAGVGALTNPALLQAALLNLALNGRDAMGATGRLTLGVAVQADPAPPPPDLGDLPPGERAELRVCDTGAGMTEAVRSRIFEPLFSTKSRGRGTGLGLFMVREFALRTHSAIQVRSTPGVGTQVRLWLPLTQTPQDAAAPPTGPALTRPPASDQAPADQAPGVPPQPQILLVDDDRRVRDSLSRVLEGAGLTVITAVDGSDALDRLAATPGIALVLSDIAMPRLDGLALYSALCCNRPELPVILMSGDAEGTQDAAALDPTALVLTKPLAPGALIELIQAMVAPVVAPGAKNADQR